jgi:hypothetical protein
MLVRMPDETLTAAQAAEEYGILKRRIQYHLLRGLLRGRQLPGSRIWLIDRGDFEAWLTEQNQQTQHKEKE